ncbi:hypothetical protein [Limisalsivibrio acetivorans]|uniref:hypothetical protein n=1 Tax=Limisalsivibrio acetivorans TaxID=1304888 RepID=UPI0003B53935|nr:hypothetical protein [Limisalsivibrio acetivorans]
MPRRLTASLLLLFLILVAGEVSARVYVYEVVTENRRFQTASRLAPKAFLYYHGGRDIIRSLTVVSAYKGDDLSKAMEDFKLGDSNFKELAPRNAPPAAPGSDRFIWWR